MTTSPFGAPSPFQPDPEPAVAQATPSTAPSGKRTKLLLAAGGVAAVAALGATALFVLPSDDADETVDAPAVAAPAPQDDADAGTETEDDAPDAPALVTQSSRNPFAALVVEGGNGAASTAPEAGTGGTAASGSGGTSSGSSSSGSSSGGSASGGSSSTPDSAAIDAALVAEINRLRAEISGIQTQIKQLQTAGGGKSNQAQVDALQARLDSLTSQLQDLVGALPVTVVFTSAAGDATTNSAVFSTSSGGVIANFDPVTEGQEITSGGGAQGTGITYLDGIDLDANGTVDMAKLSYGGLVYRVYLGEAVLIHVG